MILGKAVSPKENEENREILYIGEKSTEYFSLFKSSLNYTIYGPDTLKVYSRLKIPLLDRKSHSFGYYIILNKKDTVKTKYDKRIYSKVSSTEYKRHGFSSAGIYSLPIPPGKHEIELKPLNGANDYILVRMIIHPSLRDKGKGRFIWPDSDTPFYYISFENKRVRYLRLDTGNPLMFTIDKTKRIKLICRLKYLPEMSHVQNFRLDLSRKNEFLKTYLVQTELSDEKLLLDGTPLGIGKSKSMDIELEPGNYSLKIMDENNSVYVRVMEYEF